MKKIILIGLFGFLTTASFAAQMQFVTLLSQPVGSFAKVELPNDGTAEIFHLNFCNESAPPSTINVSGTIKAGYLKGDSTRFSSNFDEYRLSDSLEVGQSGTLDVVEMHISNKLNLFTTTNYTEADNSAYVKVARELVARPSSEQNFVTHVAAFETMNIPDIANMKVPATGETEGKDFMWTQVNASACGTSDACKAYLLKGTKK